MNITKQCLLLALLVSYIYTTKQQKQYAPHQEYQDAEFAAEYELVLAQNLGVQLERENGILQGLRTKNYCQKEYNLSLCKLKMEVLT